MQSHPYSVLTASDLSGQLIFTPCPGTKDTSVSEALATLRDAGAVALVTLMPEEELLQNEVDLLPEECQLQGIEWFHLPVEDDQAPGEAFSTAWKPIEIASKSWSMAARRSPFTARAALVAQV